MTPKPTTKPKRPFFASGPCVKYPGWSENQLSDALVGRSHRSKKGLEKIQEAVDLTRSILGIPEDYQIAITPASATGAMEMALWNLIGERGVDILSWDVFGQLWVNDLQERIGIKDLRVLETSKGCIPDLSTVDFDRDVVFTWNGSTTGVCVPDGQWISDNRKGLTICDAVSAVFAYDLPWEKLDVTIFSWQKGLGSEAAHGMIVMSPRAIERLKAYTPSWSVPLLLRLKLRGEVNADFFKGYTLNTPSMLCVEDYLLSLKWAQQQGGLPQLIKKSKHNASLIHQWLQERNWIDYMAKSPETRSHTTVCLSVVLQDFLFTNSNIQWGVIEKAVGLLEQEEAAFDIKNHRYSDPGFRIWCGPTVEAEDIEVMLPWLEWAFFNTYKR